MEYGIGNEEYETGNVEYGIGKVECGMGNPCCKVLGVTPEAQQGDLKQCHVLK